MKVLLQILKRLNALNHHSLINLNMRIEYFAYLLIKIKMIHFLVPREQAVYLVNARETHVNLL